MNCGNVASDVKGNNGNGEKQDSVVDLSKTVSSVDVDVLSGAVGFACSSQHVRLHDDLKRSSSCEGGNGNYSHRAENDMTARDTEVVKTVENQGTQAQRTHQPLPLKFRFEDDDMPPTPEKTEAEKEIDSLLCESKIALMEPEPGCENSSTVTTQFVEYPERRKNKRSSIESPTSSSNELPVKDPNSDDDTVEYRRPRKK